MVTLNREAIFADDQDHEAFLGQPDPVLAANAEYLSLASSAAQRQETWQRFLRADDRRETILRRGDWAIGDEGFRQHVLLEHGRPAARSATQARLGGAPNISLTNWCPRTNVERHHFSPR
jgi:hypothetical protein